MNQSGEIRPSIWLDGQIIGRWELDKVEGEKKYQIVWSVYQPISDEIKEIIEIERLKLQKFINHRLVPISS